MATRRFPMAGIAIALAAALSAVPSASCVLQLDHDLACGDGFVDELGGEECDPAVPSSFEDGCSGTSRPEGLAACDTEKCTIIATTQQCARCGDGIIDTEFGEECDLDNLAGAICPGGAEGVVRCTTDCTLDISRCETCGNGEVEEGEECDHNTAGDLITSRPCAGANAGQPDEILPLESTFKAYTSGVAATCRDDGTCRYDRLSCGYCNDGVRDDMSPVDFDASIPAEWCDDDVFDENRLLEEYGANFCTEPSERPNVGCGPDCRSFIERFDQARCCRRKSESCPTAGESIRCCHEFDSPDDPACEQVFEDGSLIRSICN